MCFESHTLAYEQEVVLIMVSKYEIHEYAKRKS